MLDFAMAFYGHPIILLIITVGFFMVYRKVPNVFSIGLIIGSAMQFVSVLMSISLSANIEFRDGGLVSESLAPEWMYTLSFLTGGIGLSIIAICLFGFAYKLKPQQKTPRTLT